jgi:bifunctional DNA-binding transcriptional regulator/antitoxin component of YhaV-PrlF toxin-antitoxin module
MNEIYRAKLNREGRMNVPADCRNQAGLQPGQEVLLKITPNGILLYTHDQAVKRLQDWVAANVPQGVSLVDELISDRRAEASNEANE